MCPISISFRSIFKTVSFWLLLTTALTAQDKFKTNSGDVEFYSSTPLEDILASNGDVNAILESRSGKFAVVMLVSEFQFEKKLMQEHFNENYMESDLYPKAYFSGTIEAFDLNGLGKDPLELNIEGKINIHDVSRPLNTRVNVSRVDSQIRLVSSFLIRPEDHDIDIPKIVFKKIAQEVEVSVDLLLSPVEYSK